MPEAPVMPEPRVIPLPPEFAINWPDPAMAMATWQQDRQHVPLPMTPMSGWWANHFARGFSAGIAVYDVPLGAAAARFNTYYYLAIGPNVPPEQMHEAEERAVPQLMQGIGNFWSRWENEWLPELQEGWQQWEARDLRAMSHAELAAAVADMARWYERCWTIHFEMLVPAMLGASQFQDMYAEILPGREALAAYRLAQGGDSMSLKVGRELWRISRQVAADRQLRNLVLATDAGDLWDVLDSSEAGRAVKAEITAFLAFYGRRSDTVQELGDPSWTERPAPALENLKAYLSRDEDPDIGHVRLAEQRERLVAEARAAIAGRPPEFQGMFEALLAAAQHFAVVQEDHNFWIDQRSLHEVRHLCLEVGRRLAERGALAAKDDVFLLDIDEALGALQGGNLAILVAERKAELAHWATVVPPLAVGTDYGPPPDNPITRAISRFFGAPPPASDTVDELLGNPGSPGRVGGTARVVPTIADAGRIEPGDILVTPTTSPPWTPFFAITAGIVTDTGGPLSHCAIVAREYGIPAVVGVTGATARIKDGDHLEIDGDAGVVRILR